MKATSLHVRITWPTVTMTVTRGQAAEISDDAPSPATDRAMAHAAYAEMNERHDAALMQGRDEDADMWRKLIERVKVRAAVMLGSGE